MGAAMAPAAADTISRFLKDTNTKPTDYDLILTGDLGRVGSELLIKLLNRHGTDISPVHNDCGLMIYDILFPPKAADVLHRCFARILCRSLQRVS